MRRVMYLFLPRWPIDRLRRLSGRPDGGRPGLCGAPAEAAPFATVIAAVGLQPTGLTRGGRRLLAAVNPAAAAAGLAPGMPLADALSFLPGLATAPADPAADAAALVRLAEWCGRYSPWTAPDGLDGIKIEITGSAHLWGGEAALTADLARRLSHQNIAYRIAIAGTLGTAWALARYAASATQPALPSPEQERAALAPLPVEALRLDPLTVQGLRRVGLRHVGELYPMPRDALARRFGEAVARRLDQAFGDLPEPLSPLGETPSRRVRLSFAEPIANPADLARATRRLVEDLTARLAREGVGARRLDLGFHRVDGRVEHIRLGTARPTRAARHLAGLFTAKLDTVDPGLGIEDMILAVFAVEKLPPEQVEFVAGGSETAAHDLAPLLDRLGNRLGLDAISRIEPHASHIPERASICVSIEKKTGANSTPSPPPLIHGGAERAGVMWGIPPGPPASCRHAGWKPVVQLRPTSPSHRCAMGPSLSALKSGEGFIPGSVRKPPRPVRLFQPPEPIEAAWLLPDDPPFHFTWRRRRHRVMCADGPERIAEEWWAAEGITAAACRDDAIRDYYRVEDEEGRRFWLYRAGLPGDPPPRWFVHGLFA